MKTAYDLTGKIFGKLVVLSRVDNHKSGNAMWECQCDCGNKTIVRSTDLRIGRTKSCNKCNTYREENDYMICKVVNGKEFIFDKDDYKLVSQYIWHIFIYVENRNKNKVIRLHRLLFGLENSDIQVDHVNHNKLDNRRCNLRLCTNQQNRFNERKRKNKTSIYKGVSWNKKYERWGSRITYNGKEYHLGYFISEQDAGLAYNKKAIELFGEFAWLNKI